MVEALWKWVWLGGGGSEGGAAVILACLRPSSWTQGSFAEHQPQQQQQRQRDVCLQGLLPLTPPPPRPRVPPCLPPVCTTPHTPHLHPHPPLPVTHTHTHTNRYKDAVKECGVALEASPASVKALRSRAKALEKQGLFKQALADIQVCGCCGGWVLLVGLGPSEVLRTVTCVCVWVGGWVGWGGGYWGRGGTCPLCAAQCCSCTSPHSRLRTHSTHAPNPLPCCCCCC